MFNIKKDSTIIVNQINNTKEVLHKKIYLKVYVLAEFIKKITQNTTKLT